ncbi:MAG: hypothetical protein QM770_12205 [Tepidisphaeraceae bacterium]
MIRSTRSCNWSCCCCCTAPARVWSAEDVARELRIEPGWATGQLAELLRRGLATLEQENGSRYRFGPRSSELARAIDGLAIEYQNRRVAVISRIYSKPLDPIRTFADAFRFRKPDRKEDTGHG